MPDTTLEDVLAAGRPWASRAAIDAALLGLTVQITMPGRFFGRQGVVGSSPAWNGMTVVDFPDGDSDGCICVYSRELLIVTEPSA